MGSAVEAQGRRRVRREAWPPELAPTIARGRERGHRSMQSPERVQGLVPRERRSASDAVAEVLCLQHANGEVHRGDGWIDALGMAGWVGEDESDIGTHSILDSVLKIVCWMGRRL